MKRTQTIVLVFTGAAAYIIGVRVARYGGDFVTVLGLVLVVSAVGIPQLASLRQPPLIEGPSKMSRRWALAFAIAFSVVAIVFPIIAGKSIGSWLIPLAYAPTLLSTFVATLYLPSLPRIETRSTEKHARISLRRRLRLGGRSQTESPPKRKLAGLWIGPLLLIFIVSLLYFTGWIEREEYGYMVPEHDRVGIEEQMSALEIGGVSHVHRIRSQGETYYRVEHFSLGTGSFILLSGPAQYLYDEEQVLIGWVKDSGDATIPLLQELMARQDTEVEVVGLRELRMQSDQD